MKIVDVSLMPSEFKGYYLDIFQAKAMEILSKNESVIVSAPTGSGKTLIIEYAIENLLLNNSESFLSQRNRIIYTSPIKALSNQKYRDFCNDYGKENIGIMTGDIVINRDAPLLIMTTEILRNILYISSEDPMLAGLKLVVFDEIHYLNDPFRGVVWEESLILLPDVIPVLLLSATIPNGEELRQWLNSFRKSHAIHLLEHFERPVPLKLFYFDGSLNKYDGKIVFSEKEKRKIIKKKNKSKKRVLNPLVYGNDIFSPVDVISTLPESFFPGIYFIFSRKACEKAAQSLMHINFNIFTANEQKGVNKRISIFLQSNKNLETLSQIETALDLIHNGIAFHHAGCVPILKEFIEILFAEGLIKILFATETFAMGLNLPAKSVFFHALEKYDGQEVRLLTSSEFHQMAGRAGRRGIDDYGNAIAVLNLSSEEEEISDIIEGNPEPLESQFRLSYNAIANLMQTRDQSEIVVLLQSSLKEYTAKKIRDSQSSGLINQIKKLKVNLNQIIECPKELSSNEAVKSLGDLSNLLKEIYILKERITIDFSEPDSRIHYLKIWDEILPVGMLIVYQENPSRNFKLGILKTQMRRNKKIITESSFFQSEFVLESGKILRLYPSEYFILPGFENLVEAQYFTKTREFVRLLDIVRSQINLYLKEKNLDALLTGESLILSYLSDNSINTTSPSLSQELINVEYLIEENLCSGCEYFEEHRKKYLLRKKWEKNLHQLENRVIESQNLSYEAFLKMTKVLDRIGYLEEGYLSNYGYLLAYIHHENDLLISEGIKLGYFDNLSPAELCGTIALFVAGDRDKPFEKIPKIRNKKIFNIFHKFRRINEKIISFEKAERVPEIHNQRRIGLRFVELAMRWSSGEEIEDLVQITTMLEGDIVNNLRRILNLIQQLRIVTNKLVLVHPIPFDEAIESLKRSHVISQLEDDSELDLMPYIPHKSSIENRLIIKEDFGLIDNNYLQYDEEEGISPPILRETRKVSFIARKPKKNYFKDKSRKNKSFRKKKRS
ncbi:MAG: putative ski2-type helicase [Candidatus Heimdallarchaeota archaeon LC_3]|nr:MAG: putative ski2-type helicase [Candidatus Heimdallarchaeota archaeon LC_3]